MKRKMYFWMAAACTALMAVMVSCEKPNAGENGDDGNNGDEPANVDASMTGIWTIDQDAISGLSGVYIHQFRINEDGTGEVLYGDLEDTEFLYDYSVKLNVKAGNSLEFTIDGVTPEKKVSVTYHLDEQNRLVLAFEDKSTACTYEKAEEWGPFSRTNIFVGAWESEDSYEKMYLNVEEYEFLSIGSRGVYVDKDNNQNAFWLIQRRDASADFRIDGQGPYFGEIMGLSNPVLDGENLKVEIYRFDAVRTFKPMKEWPFKNYDEIPKGDRSGELG